VISHTLVSSAVYAGQIYHCQGEDGSMSFQSTPCLEKTIKVESAKESNVPSKSSVVEDKTTQDGNNDKNKKPKTSSMTLTMSMLLGTWTDFPDESKIRGLWVFNSGLLHVTNHIGVSYTHKYELDGNILTIHHDPIPGLNQKAWKQKIVIEEFDGKRITFGEGGPAGTRYIYKIQ